MNTVVGPFTKADWNTLRMLNKSIKNMRSRDPVKFRDAIDKERNLYKGFLTPYFKININST